jgi:hypothetical protein
LKSFIFSAATQPKREDSAENAVIVGRVAYHLFFGGGPAAAHARQLKVDGEKLRFSGEQPDSQCTVTETDRRSNRATGSDTSFSADWGITYGSDFDDRPDSPHAIQKLSQYIFQTIPNRSFWKSSSR